MKIRLLPSVVILGALALAPRAARADVPPPDTCTGEGSACSKAGPGYNMPGVCTTSTCQRATPDGSTSYACLRCLQSDAGTGGSAGSTASGGSSGKSSSSGGDSGGCSLAAAPAGSGLAGFALVAGAAALAVSRRRR